MVFKHTYISDVVLYLSTNNLAVLFIKLHTKFNYFSIIAVQLAKHKHNILCCCLKSLTALKKHIYVWPINNKGIVHLNIIFSYMKFNKICNLDYPIF